MKKSVCLFPILALAFSASLLAGCSSDGAAGITWAEGYEKCSIHLIAENKLVIGLKDNAFGALPSNTALSGNVTSQPIFKEDKEELVSAKANIIAARENDYENDTAYANKINALCALLAREDTANYINTTFSGKVTYAYDNLTGYTEEDGAVVEAYKGTGTITVAASETPHAVILEHIKASLKSDYGYDLVISTMDWQLQNLALSKGEIDANYFQHIPYLETFEPQDGGASLKAIAKVHYEPLGVYKGNKAKEDTIYNGASIEICNDSSNAERALDLLKDKGYIVSYDLTKMHLA